MVAILLGRDPESRGKSAFESRCQVTLPAILFCAWQLSVKRSHELHECAKNPNTNPKYVYHLVIYDSIRLHLIHHTIHSISITKLNRLIPFSRMIAGCYENSIESIKALFYLSYLKRVDVVLTVLHMVIYVFPTNIRVHTNLDYKPQVSDA
jgi:hypothetical protein